MKIKKIAHKLGSDQVFIKNIVPKTQVKNIVKTTGIKKIYNCKKNEDIISLAYDASKKIIKKKRQGYRCTDINNRNSQV